jgi:sugar phosphate isomerase/epimerase
VYHKETFTKCRRRHLHRELSRVVGRGGCVLTAPGEACINLSGVIAELAAVDHKGWLVIEAE